MSDTDDVDGDGVGDILVGAYRDSQRWAYRAGAAHLYSGATGNLIRRLDGQANADGFGGSVAGVGDVDGDGIGELLIGASEADPAGSTRAGSAYLYSGATGVMLRQWDGQSAGERLGYSVSAIGDLDADGVEDLLVGVIGAGLGGLLGAGAADVYSGATGNLIHRFDGREPGESLGYSVASAGDMDGDGVDDAVLGAPFATPGGLHNAGSVAVYSGATGGLIRRFEGQTNLEALGASVSGAGDMDGDGLTEVIVGATAIVAGAPPDSGLVRVFSLDPFLHSSAASVSASGGADLQLGMAFPASEAGERYAVLASLAGTGPTTIFGLDIPLTQDGLFQRSISGNAPAPLLGAYGTLNASAQAVATMRASPALAAGIGRTLNFAAVTYDPSPTAGRMSSIVRSVMIVP